jgi:hypothetical protein
MTIDASAITKMDYGATCTALNSGTFDTSNGICTWSGISSMSTKETTFGIQNAGDGSANACVKTMSLFKYTTQYCDDKKCSLELKYPMHPAVVFYLNSNTKANNPSVGFTFDIWATLNTYFGIWELKMDKTATTADND